MKKIILILCSLLFAGYSLADGAFGTYKGMTKEELEKKGVIVLKTNPNGSIVSKNAPTPNPLIETYIYSFDANMELCSVRGVTKLYKSIDGTGKNLLLLKSDFETFEKILTEKYGEPKTINIVKNKYKNNWFYGSIKKEDKKYYSLNPPNEQKEFSKTWGIINENNKFLLSLYPFIMRSVDDLNLGYGFIVFDYAFERCTTASIDKSKGL